MVNRDAFKQPVGDLDQRLQGIEKTLQAAQSEIANVRKMMAASAGHCEPVAAVPLPARPPRVAIANGRRLTAAEFAKLDEEDYDVVLNLTNGTLRVRRKPGSPSKLKGSPLKKIGGHRIEVLEYMLTHPGRHFSADTVYNPLGETREANTFTKTISTLREALGTPGPQNPYILTAPAWEESAQARACIYVLNEKHNYLVIRSSEEIIGNSP